jgi:hypothetical protein
MRLPTVSAVCLALTAALGLSACASAYKSYWKQTNFKQAPAPVAPNDVKVVKSRDNLTSSWVELGIYRGKAPTVNEAMDTAKQECGAHGANVYVLNTEPFAAGGGYKVDGVCGRI